MRTRTLCRARIADSCERSRSCGQNLHLFANEMRRRAERGQLHFLLFVTPTSLFLLPFFGCYDLVYISVFEGRARETTAMASVRSLTPL